MQRLYGGRLAIDNGCGGWWVDHCVTVRREGRREGRISGTEVGWRGSVLEWVAYPCRRWLFWGGRAVGTGAESHVLVSWRLAVRSPSPSPTLPPPLIHRGRSAACTTRTRCAQSGDGGHCCHLRSATAPPALLRPSRFTTSLARSGGPLGRTIMELRTPPLGLLFSVAFVRPAFCSCWARLMMGRLRPCAASMCFCFRSVHGGGEAPVRDVPRVPSLTRAATCWTALVLVPDARWVLAACRI